MGGTEQRRHGKGEARPCYKKNNKQKRVQAWRENLPCDRLDWESQLAHSFFLDAYSSQTRFPDTFKLIFEMGYSH